MLLKSLNPKKKSKRNRSGIKTLSQQSELSRSAKTEIIMELSDSRKWRYRCLSPCGKMMPSRHDLSLPISCLRLY